MIGKVICIIFDNCFYLDIFELYVDFYFLSFKLYLKLQCFNLNMFVCVNLDFILEKFDGWYFYDFVYY